MKIKISKIKTHTHTGKAVQLVIGRTNPKMNKDIPFKAVPAARKILIEIFSAM